MMDKKVRSPSYPAFGLREAVEKVRTLVGEINQSTTTREVVAKAMGYSGLSGASATAISALNKYGLLEGRNDAVRVTDRAMAIVKPLTEEERAAALRAAAMEPPLFRELAEKFKGMNLNVELFRNYLERNGFGPVGADQAISAYKETIEFVGGLDRVHDSAPKQDEESMAMNTNVEPLPRATPPTVARAADDAGDMRTLHRFDMRKGGTIEIRISRNVDDLVALKVIEASLPGLKVVAGMTSPDDPDKED